MSLKGGPELRARLKALRVSFKPIGRKWADTVVEVARPKIPVRTGKARQTLRVKSATQRRALVTGSYILYFLDKGPVRHTINAKRSNRLIFEAGGRTIFTKKVNHPGYRGRKFRAHAAHEALRRNPMAAELIKQWNSAA